MKTKFYFLLAKIFVKICYWADIISIAANYRYKIYTIRAIAASHTSEEFRVKTINLFHDLTHRKPVDTAS